MRVVCGAFHAWDDRDSVVLIWCAAEGVALRLVRWGWNEGRGVAHRAGGLENAEGGCGVWSTARVAIAKGRRHTRRTWEARQPTDGSRPASSRGAPPEGRSQRHPTDHTSRINLPSGPASRPPESQSSKSRGRQVVADGRIADGVDPGRFESRRRCGATRPPQTPYPFHPSTLSPANSNSDSKSTAPAVSSPRTSTRQAVE